MGGEEEEEERTVELAPPEEAERRPEETEEAKRLLSVLAMGDASLGADADARGARGARGDSRTAGAGVDCEVRLQLADLYRDLGEEDVVRALSAQSHYACLRKVARIGPPCTSLSVC